MQATDKQIDHKLEDTPPAKPVEPGWLSTNPVPDFTPKKVLSLATGRAPSLGRPIVYWKGQALCASIRSRQC